MAENNNNILITLSECYLLMLKDESVPLIATISPTGKATGAEIGWTSSNDSCVVVDGNGKVTAKAIGKSVITASVTIDNVKYEATCTVEVVSVTLSETGLLMEKDESLTLSVGPASKLKNASVTWTSSNASCASVDKNGQVTAVQQGDATVTAKIQIEKRTYTAECSIKVVESITLNATKMKMLKGGSSNLSLINLSNATVKWESNKKIVEVDDTGKVTAKEVGKAIVSALVTVSETISGTTNEYSCTRKCTIEVLAITLNEKYLSMLVGDSKDLSVNIPIDELEATDINWESSNAEIITVTAGNVKAIAVGEATVTAKVKIGGQDYSVACKIEVHADKVDKFKGDIKEKRNEFVEKNKYDNLSGYQLEFSTLSKNSTDATVTVSKTVNLQQGDEGNKEGMVLTDVLFHKEAYQPAYLEVVIKTQKTLSEFNDIIINSLKYVNLYEAEIQLILILTDYIVFEKKKKGGYVTLKAYSFDKFLTLKKESRAFTAKPLSTILSNTGKAIINTYSDNVTALKYLMPHKENSNSFDAVGLQYLMYKKNEKDVIKKEYNLPYSVQYDETFYDFLIRICNRNGEFLYCKNNTLYVGLPDISSVKKIGSAKVEDIEYTDNLEFADTAYSEVIVPDDYKNEKDNTDHVIQKGKEYVKLGDFTPPGATVIEYLRDFAEAPTIYQALLGTTFKLPIHLGASAVARDNINKKFNTTYFSTEATKNLKNIFLLSGDGDLLADDFYTKIFENQEKVKQKQVVVKFLSAPNDKTFDVGDIVQIDNGETLYVVHSVKGSAKVVDTIFESQRDGDGDSKKGEKIKRYKESYELLLLPAVDGKYYPLPKPEMRIRKANPQKAIVCNTLDPLFRGRARVIFDWQDKNTKVNQTPWLNITYPKASKEEGFMFIPNIGDDVLVDFVEGNIERPFIVGSYYGDGEIPHIPAGPASMHMLGVTKSITSKNGHHISFEDTPGNARFLGGVLPIWSLLQKFGVGVETKDDEEAFGNKLSGGFEISDYYGIYKISGSSHERNLSISSPYGDVKIDAFTGISIEAPLGDVRICGKNVEIEARNNLTITSGTNIGQPYFGSRNGKGGKGAAKSLGMGGLSYLIGLLPGILKTAGIDFSLYRHMLEALLRPIGGTMLIKSYRYMKMEAGEGKADIVRTRKSFKDGGWKAVGRTLIRSAFSDKPELRSYKTKVDEAITEVEKDVIAYNTFVEIYNDLRSNDFDKFKTYAGNLSNFPDELRTLSKCFTLNKTGTPVKANGTKSFTDYFDQNKTENDVNLEEIVKSIMSKIVKLYTIDVELTNTPSNTNTPPPRNNPHLAGAGDLPAIDDIMGTNIPTSYNPPAEIEKMTLECAVNNILIKLKGVMLVASTNTNQVKLTDKVDMAQKVTNSVIDYYQLFKPKVENVSDALTTPGLGKIILSSLESAAHKALGGEGFYDDNAWAKNEKGGIYMSAHKDRTYYMHEDGSLKLGNQDSVDNISLTEYIRNRIRNLKLE